jgi:hypothetical protein
LATRSRSTTTSGAFLNAGRTVDYRLINEQGAIYKPWRKAWDQRLASDENQLIKFMVDDRNAEVHATGCTRTAGQEGVDFGIGKHQLPSGGGTLTVEGIPATLSGSNIPPATLYRPTYSFTIDGTDRKATVVCREYLALLLRMVAQFAADHP